MKKENALIAAHTSSGKTVIAEYTIANAFYLGKKIIYTSPIKALSNQKFRDFSNLFSKIGLMTGDMTVNPTADCVVMTTEILRTLLYENLLIKNEIEWIIFDETHYIKDRERGYIWEEILILLPRHIRIICLSATIPNTREFAEWIADIKKSTINVIQTSKRPVVLQHYIFSRFNPGLHLVTDNKGFFIQKKYWEIFNKNKSEKKKYVKKFNLKDEIKKITEKIFQIGYWPIIIFSFGKQQCFHLLFSLRKQKLCEQYEIKIIRTFFKKCFTSLSDKIKNFLRLNYIFYFFKRGLGIHHSGILPLVREITEILFQATLIKVLCATETFSIGLNMPAKAVIFSSTAKFDGQSLRILNKSEFIQMSGRAGRRGIDNKGMVITIIDNFVDKKEIRAIIQGKTEPVISMFRLNLNTVLKNIRNKKTYDVTLFSNSFFKYQNYLFKIKKKKILIQIKTRIFQLVFPLDEKLYFLTKIWNLYEKFKTYLNKIIFFNNLAKEIFKSKLILYDQTNKSQFYKNIFRKIENLIIVIFSFLENIKSIEKDKLTFRNYSVENINIIYLFMRLISIDKTIIWDIMEIYGKQTNSIQIITICLIKLSIYYSYLILIQIKYQKIFILSVKKKKINLIYNIKQKQLNSKSNFAILKHITKLNKALKLLKIIDYSNKLTFKGSACSDLNFEDDILLIELIFSGKFNKLSIEKLTSLIAVFFSQEISFKKKLHPDLEIEMKYFQKIFKKMGTICENTFLYINIIKYLGKIDSTIPNTIYGICQGVNFMEINYTNILIEDTIGKNIKRLNNLLIQLSRVSEKLGNINLSIKFDNCSSKLEESFLLMKFLYY
nr:RNA helicase ATP-dependent, SK12/DOB1 protein [Cryptomonas curvata]